MKHVLILMTLLSLLSCVETPTNTSDQAPYERGGVFVLCEGLWQQNNSTLSYIRQDGVSIRDMFAGSIGVSIGDTPTDMVRVGDSIFIAVNTARQIALVNVLTGKYEGAIVIGVTRQPFRIAASGDRLYVTNQNDDSITEITTRPFQVETPRVEVGPAPEGIAVVSGKIYVGLSGYGDFRKDEEGAGTIVILSQADLSTIGRVSDLPNVADIESDGARNRVWATYRHFPSQPDSLGGVVLIDASTDAVVQSWRYSTPTSVSIDRATGDAYVLHAKGIDKLTADGGSQVVALHTSGSGSDVWYSISFDQASRALYIGNARQFVTDGEVIVMRPDGSISQRYNVGLNPNTMVF